MNKMSWSIKQWKDVLSIVNGKNQKEVQSDNGMFPIIGSGGEIGRANDFLCEAGSTVVGRKGTINNPFFVGERFWNVDTAFGIQPGENLNPKFLFYFCKGYNFKKLDKSTTIPSLAKTDLLKIEMPVPSLDEQEKIVNRIEELFSELDSAVETLKKTKEQLAVYRQSVLKDAFEGAEGKSTRLDDLCEFITKGTTPPKNTMNAAASSVPFIKVYNLTFDLKLDFSIDPTFVDEKTHQTFLARSKVLPGDVLMNIVGPPMGKVSIVPETYPEWNINQAIARFRCKEILDNRYLAYYLGYQPTVESMMRQSKATAGQFNLTLEICRNIQIPLIPMEKQKRIASKIEYQMSACKNVEKTVNDALAQAEAMRQSILKKAFEGGL
jgi:type I restriction enzyme S subunit